MERTNTEARSTLVKGLFFVAPLIAGFVAMECGLRHVVTRGTHGRAQIEALQGVCQVLVLGTSNAAYDIEAESLSEPAVNVADVTQSLYYDLAIAERYVPGMPRLKSVILALSYVTFESESYDWQGGWVRWPYYAQQWDLPPQKASFFEAQRWSLTALYGVRMSISYARKGFRVSTIETPSTQVASTEVDPEEGARSAKEHERAIHPERARDNLARLDRLAALVEQRGATLAVIYTPTQDSYLRHLSSSVTARNTRNLNEFLRHHPKVIYRDYLRDQRFTGDDFRDPVHLNRRGAEKFSKIVDAEVVRPASAPP